MEELPVAIRCSKSKNPLTTSFQASCWRPKILEKFILINSTIFPIHWHKFPTFQHALIYRKKYKIQKGKATERLSQQWDLPSMAQNCQCKGNGNNGIGIRNAKLCLPAPAADQPSHFHLRRILSAPFGFCRIWMHFHCSLSSASFSHPFPSSRLLLPAVPSKRLLPYCVSTSCRTAWLGPEDR